MNTKASNVNLSIKMMDRLMGLQFVIHNSVK